VLRAAVNSAVSVSVNVVPISLDPYLLAGVINGERLQSGVMDTSGSGRGWCSCVTIRYVLSA
jgi:hypothetical protein